MKKIILLLLAVSGLTAVSLADDDAKEYSQTYAIFLNGVRAGKEIVSEKTDDNGDRVVVTQNEVYVTDGLETKRMAYTTKMVLKKESLKPKSYLYQYLTGNTGDSYEVIVDGDEITRTLYRGGDSSVIKAPFNAKTVILDFTDYQQYNNLVRKYDSKEKGRQLFSGFLPVIGNDIPVALTYLNDASVPYFGGNVSVTNYKIEFVGLLQGTVSVDKNNRLVRLVMPEQDMEVIREDLVPANR